MGAGAYLGTRYFLSPPGRYFLAQKLWHGKAYRVKPVVEEAMARAAKDLGLPPPYPQLLCRPDSTGISVCTSSVRLRPGVSTIQGNARFSDALTGLGLDLVSGVERADGSVDLRYRAGRKVLVALELIPATGTGLDTTLTPGAGLPPVEVRARLALVIEDYGDAPEVCRGFAALPGTFTAAVRSNREGARDLAARARRAGMEVVLDLPLEAKNYPLGKLGEDAILVDLSGREIRKRVRRALQVVGPVKGVKTCLGSLAVEDRDVMRAVLEEIHKRGLFFLDTASSPYSTVQELAHEIGVPLYQVGMVSRVDERWHDAGSIGIRFDDLVRSARSRGYAIGIIHPRRATLEVLRDRLPRLAREGIVVLGLSQVMKAHALE